MQRDRDTASLNLTLPTDAYPAADYVIRVFNVTGGRKTLATYSVAIRHTR